MPNGFSIGPLFVHFYGIVIMIGVLAGSWLAQQEANRWGQDGKQIWDLLIWILIFGIVGARLWHILTPSPSLIDQGITTWYYFTHPLDAVAIWNGGLGIPGAVIGGILALWVYARKHKLPFLIWLDILAPSVALGQAIGRWGNFFNQELYGAPTQLPWAIFIDSQHRLPGYENQAMYHPLFLYESLWNLANMFLLLWVGRKYADKLSTGDIFLSYLVTYPFCRFMLEFLRLDSSQLGGINANQTFMLFVMIVAVVVLLWKHRPGQRFHGVLADEGNNESTK